MPDVCNECQKLIDISNSNKLEYYDEELVMISYEDDIMNRTDECIQRTIEQQNAIINHFENCVHKGCKELMENWKPYHIAKTREDLLN